MSLSYDLTKCEPLPYQDESLPEAERDAAWSWTQAVIFRTMAVGMGSITKDNALDFYHRCVILDRLTGNRTPFSFELIQAHIGLTTNVTLESESKWRKRVLDGAVQEIRYETIRNAAGVE